MALTHSDIAPAANRGEHADAGKLYTYPGAPSRFDSYYGSSWMPRQMSQALDALAAIGIRAEQTIVSFNTPIAMRYTGADGRMVWIMAESNYSSRTAQQVSKLRGGWNRSGLAGRIERVPFDVTAADLRRIIDGKMCYVPDHRRGHVGRYVPGPNYIPGE